MMALVLSWGISVLITVIFQCDPVSSVVHPAKQKHCIDALKFFLGNGISAMLLDVIILCMPIPMILRLQVFSWRRKVAILGIFLLGSL